MEKAKRFLLATLCLCAVFSAFPALGKSKESSVSEFAKEVDKHAQAGAGELHHPHGQRSD